MDLKDKVAVVTGASSGLGWSFSQALVRKGAVVYGLARNTEKLQELKSELGDRFYPIACDVMKEEDVDNAFGRVVEESGRIDILVNNAGLARRGAITELSSSDWDVQMDTNARGTFLCSRLAVPIMARQNESSGFGGHIVNIASIAGLLGNPQLSGYNASKFAVRGFSDALMKEVRDDGIKVTCIYPGSVDTNFAAVSGGGISPNAMTADDLAETLIHVLETSDNYLISELVMRPLRPRG